jgi:hypothetical protein
MHGITLAELEAEAFEVLPGRNTMALIEIGSLTALNGLNVLNNNNIQAIANILANDNKNEQEGKVSSNDLITCLVGHSFDAEDSCHD